MARVRRRAAPSKRGRMALLVCAEGETERDYFNGLRRSLHVPREMLFVAGDRGTSVRNIAEFLNRARKGCVRNLPDVTFDQLWGVVDTEWKDDWKAYATRPSTLPAGDLQKRAPILWAVSSSSFERWLLLHFESRPPRLNAHDSAARIAEFLPGYFVESKHLSTSQIDTLLDRTDIALENARQWRSQCESPENFTDVDLLVRTILDTWSNGESPKHLS